MSPVIELPLQAQEEPLLSEQLHRVQTMEDIEALASEELTAEQEKPVAVGTEKPACRQEEGKAAPKPANNQEENHQLAVCAVWKAPGGSVPQPTCGCGGRGEQRGAVLGWGPCWLRGCNSHLCRRVALTSEE